MGFRENLLKKIQIDKMTATVRKSLGGGYDGGPRIDKAVMKQLLAEGPYDNVVERDLDLYIKRGEEGPPWILVLDNDLPVYRTTAADVALRKSPTIKEMISLKNAVKILNDGDVVKSKKTESLETVRREILGRMDLSFDRNDIEEMEAEGKAFLEKEYVEGIRDTLKLYAEILGLAPVPKPLQMPHHLIFSGKTDRSALQPVILYSIATDKLRLYEDPVAGTDKEKAEFIKGLSSGVAKSHGEGEAVFARLTEMAMGLPDAGPGFYHPRRTG